MQTYATKFVNAIKIRDCKPKHIYSAGGWAYSISSLIQALLLSRLVRNTGRLPEVIVRSITFALGPGIAQQVQREIDSAVGRIPDDGTLSRARLKLDCVLETHSHFQYIYVRTLNPDASQTIAWVCLD